MYKLQRCLFILAVVPILIFAHVPVSADGFEWTTVEPKTVGLDRAPLDQPAERIAAHPEFNVHSVLVVKDGKLAFEAYFSGVDQDWGTELGNVKFDLNTRHDLRSVSRSVTSATSLKKLTAKAEM